MLSLLEDAVLIKITKVINELIKKQLKQDCEKITSYQSKGISASLKNLEAKSIKIKIHSFPFIRNYKAVVINSELNIIKCNDVDADINIEESCNLSIELTLGSILRTGLIGIEQSIREQDIKLSGDINIAMELQALVDTVDFDFYETLQARLTSATSDVFAWQFVSILKKILQRVGSKHSELSEQITDYLQIEKKVLVSKYEVEDFCREVDKLRDDIARLEARIENVV